MTELPGTAEQIQMLLTKPTSSRWDVEIERVLSGQRAGRVEHLGSVSDYVQVLISSSEDTIKSRGAFRLGLEKVVVRWSPGKYHSVYYTAGILDLIGDFAPPSGFGKIFTFMRQGKRFPEKTDPQETIGRSRNLHRRALRSLEQYVSVAPINSQQVRVFDNYVGLLRNLAKNPADKDYAAARLQQLGAETSSSSEGTIINPVKRLIDEAADLSIPVLQLIAGGDHNESERLKVASHGSMLPPSVQLNDKIEKVKARRHAADLFAQGMLYERRGDFVQAEAEFSLALPIFESLMLDKSIGDTYTHFGKVRSALGQYEMALNDFEKALTIHKKRQERDEAARDLLGIGQVHAIRGLDQKALETFEDALKWADTSSDRIVADIAMRKGGVYLDQHKYQLAEAEFAKALSLYQLMSDTANSASAMRNFGLTRVFLGEDMAGKREGLEMIEQSITDAERIEAKAVAAKGRMMYAEALAQSDTPEVALNYLQDHWDQIAGDARANIVPKARELRVVLLKAVGREDDVATDQEAIDAFKSDAWTTTPKRRFRTGS